MIHFFKAVVLGALPFNRVTIAIYTVFPIYAVFTFSPFSVLSAISVLNFKIQNVIIIEVSLEQLLQMISLKH